jgi:hypothetical protein
VLPGAQDHIGRRGAQLAVPLQLPTPGTPGADVGQVVRTEERGLTRNAALLVGKLHPGLQAGQDLLMDPAFQRAPCGSGEQDRTPVAQDRDRLQMLRSGTVIDGPRTRSRAQQGGLGGRILGEGRKGQQQGDEESFHLTAPNPVLPSMV